MAFFFSCQSSGFIQFICLILLIDSTRSQRNGYHILHEGQNAVFVCDPTGQPVSDALLYQWTFNDTEIIATDQSFTIRNVRERDSGIYKCTVRGNLLDKEFIAEQSTFAYVKQAETMHTQIVDEGVSITIMCNVTQEAVPAPGYPSKVQYEWRDPNGTLVGNQWLLRIANIRLYESGVYVCSVSADIGGSTQHASQATNILVKRAGDVTFPGVIGTTVEVIETASFHQICKVKSDSNANYTYQWLGPDGRVVSDTSLLHIDYVIRSMHPGAYTCIATPTELGHVEVQDTIYLVVSPLRFQISRLAENLEIGGFTHRRASIALPLLSPTKEVFEYTWLDPSGQLVNDGGTGPDMFVQLNSSDQFGVFRIRVRGVNSGYVHELQSEVLQKSIDPERYKIVLSGLQDAIKPGETVDVECRIEPPVSSASIHWTNDQNVPISSDGRLFFQSFSSFNDGNYICEVVLPDGNLLRRFIALQMSNFGDKNETSTRYSVFIVREPAILQIGADLNLQCMIRPEPPGRAVYEWSKDGQFLGTNSRLTIPVFGRHNAGRYQCRANLNGIIGYAYELINFPSDDSFELVMHPKVLNTTVFKPFEIECTSLLPGLSPLIVFSSGADVSLDGQFEVLRADSQRAIITAPNGLSAVYNGIIIKCNLPNGNTGKTHIFVSDPCPSGEVSCRSLECIPIGRICDSTLDCKDGSDETGQFCYARLLAIPPVQRVRPMEPFNVVCRSTFKGQAPSARFPITGGLVESDSRFILSRPNIEELIIKAPYGVKDTGIAMMIECFFPNEGTRVALIKINGTGATPDCFGGYQCNDGTCIESSMRCDGQFNCMDGSDEANCSSLGTQCPVGEFLCASGECRSTSNRCDGQINCRDGSDERGCPDLGTTCLRDEFKCGSGECVKTSHRCDGKLGCRDGTDERDCREL